VLVGSNMFQNAVYVDPNVVMTHVIGVYESLRMNDTMGDRVIMITWENSYAF